MKQNIIFHGLPTTTSHTMQHFPFHCHYLSDESLFTTHYVFVSKAVSRKAPGIPGIEDDPVKTKTDKVKIGLIKAVIFMVVIVFTVTIIIYVSRRHTRINAGEINENRMEMTEIGYSHVRLLTQRRLLTRLIMSGRAVLSMSILFNLIQSL
jgi:hypothetical protein